MYGATKAFCSSLAASMHIELNSLGIDVCAVHPSPVASNFYDKLDHKIEILESATKNAVPPDALPDDIFRSIGCCALRDLGGKKCHSVVIRYHYYYLYHTYPNGICSHQLWYFFLPTYQYFLCML
jgi:hypothetical protein